MLHPSAHRLGRLGLAVLTVVIGVGSLATPVAARVAVDPSTLNPPPTLGNPQCAWAGQQVICSFAVDFTVTDAPTGIFCDGVEVLESSDRHVAGQRYYNADLDLTRRLFREQIDGILYNPTTGGLVRWTGTDTGVEVLSIPGDRDTGTLTNTGAGLHFYLADGRSLVIAGRTIENFDTGDFAQVGSSPDFDLCASLV
jgi:hypothetical protein